MFTLLALAAVLQTATSIDAEAVAKAEIGAVLDQMNVASSAANLDGYLAVFTPDARFVGTDRNERWTLAELKAFTEPYFSQGKGWSYAPSDREVTVADIECRCIAWFDEQLSNPSYGHARGSGVMRLTPQGWKIAQYVLSFPVPNAIAEDVSARIRDSEAATTQTAPIQADPAP